MALSQSALSELLEAFRAGDGVDLIRESVRVALQELIEAEATERIGAAPYERTESRVTERNDHRTRSLSTKAGDVDLRIPKGCPLLLDERRVKDEYNQTADADPAEEWRRRLLLGHRDRGRDRARPSEGVPPPIHRNPRLQRQRRDDSRRERSACLGSHRSSGGDGVHQYDVRSTAGRVGWHHFPAIEAGGASARKVQTLDRRGEMLLRRLLNQDQ